MIKSVLTVWKSIQAWNLLPNFSGLIGSVSPNSHYDNQFKRWIYPCNWLTTKSRDGSIPRLSQSIGTIIPLITVWKSIHAWNLFPALGRFDWVCRQLIGSVSPNNQLKGWIFTKTIPIHWNYFIPPIWKSIHVWNLFLTLGRFDWVWLIGYVSPHWHYDNQFKGWIYPKPLDLSYFA